MLVTARPLIVLGIITAPPGPVYPVMVIAPLLVVKVNWACTTAGSVTSDRSRSSLLNDVFIPDPGFQEQTSSAVPDACDFTHLLEDGKQRIRAKTRALVGPPCALWQRVGKRRVWSLKSRVLSRGAGGARTLKVQHRTLSLEPGRAGKGFVKYQSLG